MRLSQTTRAAEWLRQFESDDRDAAVALLDTILFAPGGAVMTGVRQTIEQFLQREADRVPVVLLPVLAVEDMRGQDGVKLSPGAEPTVFAEFDPGQLLDSEPGSEALFAQQIREVKRGLPKNLFVPTPLTRDAMRDSRARTLICVTDYIGSGQQVTEYVDAWYRHSSIRSWRSLGLLKIVVVAYAATRGGKEAVRSHRGVDAAYVKEIVPGIAEVSFVDSRVHEICRRYAKRGKLGTPLGYRDSAGLFASSFSVPNNLPAILIRRSSTWTPFFDGRSVTANLAEELGSQRPVVDVPQRVEDAGRIRLATRLRESPSEMRWQTHLSVLSLLPATEEELALKLGVEVERIEQLVDALTRLNLINEEGRPTEAGRQALDRHRRKPRRVSAELHHDPSPYYPRLKR